jgi:hypothetical protein
VTRRIAAMLGAGLGIASLSAGAGVAIAAPGAPAGTARTGQFRTWPAAQSAAGFRLAEPARTYGLRRNGEIVVSRCEQQGKLGKRAVIAIYGDTPNAGLRIDQNNSGSSCGVIGRSTRLGRYMVDGTWAILTGACGLHGLPSCTSRRIFLFLSWRRHGTYYRAMSHDEPRSVIAGFARGLAPVR